MQPRRAPELRCVASHTRFSLTAGRGASLFTRKTACIPDPRAHVLPRSGNPGPAGGGAVLLCERDTPVAEAAVWLGPHSTCNEAEYTGLIAGLRLAARCGVQRLRVQGGASELILLSS
jgi:hypothetical protein